MEKEVVVYVDGRVRRVLKITEKKSKKSEFNFIQIFPYVGINLGYSNERPIGSNKYSIHPPRPGQEEFTIHFKVVKPGLEGLDLADRWLDHRHKTTALFTDTNFAHIVSARCTRLTTATNDPKVKAPDQMMIPRAHSSKEETLLIGVFVGKLGTPFEVPANSEIGLLRIDGKDFSVIVLYSFAKNPSMDYGYFLPTVTTAIQDIDDARGKEVMASIMRGGDASFSIDHFIWHSIEMLIEYWRRVIWAIDEVAGLNTATPEEVEGKRQFALYQIALLEAVDDKRLGQMIGGRHLPDNFNWDMIKPHGD